MSLLGLASEVKARKPHWCWWCGEAIERGAKYFRWTWSDGDGLLTCKAHPECREAWFELGEEVEFAEFSRGCCCERGFCKCKGDS